MANENELRPLGRSLSDFAIEGSTTKHKLLPAEEILLDIVREGKPCEISQPRPEAAAEGKENVVRAGFLRFLALRGDDRAPVHERGILLKGAYVTGEELDLQGCKDVLPIFLECCWFEGRVNIRDAHTRTINLDGSRVDFLDAKRAKVNGSIYLRQERHDEDTGENAKSPFISRQGVNLIDSNISGSLECHQAQFGAYRGASIHASRARIRGSVFLHQSFAAEGPIFFRGSTIGGNFECSGGSFSAAGNKYKIAISCEGAKIHGSVYFRQFEGKGHRFEAKGEVRFIDAEIGGSFECHGAKIENPSGKALHCSRINVKGSVFTHQGFSAKGEVGFRGSTIGGNFECSGGSFDNEGDIAISCHGTKILGSVYFRQFEQMRFAAKGQINFIDGDIGGSFECHGANIENPNGFALYCSRIKVNGSVLLYDAFSSKGEISFRRADIGGNFDASDSTLSNADGKALSCESAHITGALLLKRKFKAEGQVTFAGADIEGDLDCDNGKFLAAAGTALDCERARISGEVSLGAGFRAEGEVTFAGAVVGGKFNCSSGSFINPRADSGDDGQKRSSANAITLRSAVIKGELCLAAAGVEPALIYGSLDLRDAQAAVLTDDENSWPPRWVEAGAYGITGELRSRKWRLRTRSRNLLESFIYLNGFTYSHFGEGSPLSSSVRKKWLLRQPPSDLGRDASNNFTTQPFEQLATVLRETGNGPWAREIAMIKLERQLRRDDNGKSWLFNPVNWFRWLVLEKAVGYGYRWERVLYVSFAVWLGFSVFYSFASRQGAFCRVKDVAITGTIQKDNVNQQGGLCPEVQKEIPKQDEFNPWVYSVEALLVAPQTISAYVIFPQFRIQQRTINLNHFDSYRPMHKPLKLEMLGMDLPEPTAEFMTTLEIVISWIASALLLAVATGFIKRE